MPALAGLNGEVAVEERHRGCLPVPVKGGEPSSNGRCDDEEGKCHGGAGGAGVTKPSSAAAAAEPSKLRSSDAESCCMR